MGTDLLDRMGELIGTALGHWAASAGARSDDRASAA
jgi:hypothetical protein